MAVKMQWFRVFVIVSAVFAININIGVPVYADNEFGDKVKRAREMVKNNLADPYSAKFRNDRVVTGKSLNAVCGQVNMKNRMGGYNGYITYAVTFNPKTNGEWKVLFPVGGAGEILYEFGRNGARLICKPKE